MITFIVNPAAGSGRALTAAPIIRRLMDKSGQPYEIIETTAPAHASELAKQAADNGSHIVASVGGDGTIQEVACGLVNTDAALAVIPAGSGNDFLRSLNPTLKPAKNFEARIEQFVKLLLTTAPVTIDAVRMNTFYFFNIGSVGIDAEISLQATDLKPKFGSSSYLVSTLQNIFTYTPKLVRVECDGEAIESQLSLVAVSNGSFYGGGFKISPGADITDGKITLCVIDKLSRPMFGLLFPLVIFGAHTKLKQVRYIDCKQVTLRYEGVMPVNLDGNIYNLKAPLDFEIVEGGLKVIRG